MDKSLFPPCRRPPEYKDKRPVLLCKNLDTSVRKFFPAYPAVGVGFMGAHSQDRVEKQYALLRPWCKIPVVRNRASEIAVQLLIDVDQRRGYTDSLVHGEAQTVGLTFPMVGILPENDYLHFLERREIEGVEDIVTRRIDHMRSVFMDHRLIKLCIVRLAEFRLESRFPFTCNSHDFSHFELTFT